LSLNNSTTTEFRRFRSTETAARFDFFAKFDLGWRHWLVNSLTFDGSWELEISEAT